MSTKTLAFAAVKPVNIPGDLVTKTAQFLHNFGVDVSEVTLQNIERIRGANGARPGWRIHELITGNRMMVTVQYAASKDTRWKLCLTCQGSILRDTFGEYIGSGWETSFEPHKGSEGEETVTAASAPVNGFDPAKFWHTAHVDQLKDLLGSSWTEADLSAAVEAVLGNTDWAPSALDCTEPSLAYLTAQQLVGTPPIPSGVSVPVGDGLDVMQRVTAYVELMQRRSSLEEQLGLKKGELTTKQGEIAKLDPVKSRPRFTEDQTFETAQRERGQAEDHVQELERQLEAAKRTVVLKKQGESQARQALDTRIKRHVTDARQPLDTAIKALQTEAQAIEGEIAQIDTVLETPAMVTTAQCAQMLKKL